MIDVNEELFHNIKDKMLVNLTRNIIVSNDKTAYIFGGQPGAGKSTWIKNNSDVLSNYVKVFGFDEILSYINPDYLKKINDTKELFPYMGKIIEESVESLSNCGYNLVIEGTLRTTKVPMKTTDLLKNRGYKVGLVVIACPVVLSYLGSILRCASNLSKNAISPILTKEQYDSLVRRLPDNLDWFYTNNKFDFIKIYDRVGTCLYDSAVDDYNPADVLKNVIYQKKSHSKEAGDIIEKIRKIKSKTVNI